MKAAEKISLLPYNTFSMKVHAHEMYTLTQPGECENFPVGFRAKIIGGGSNILLTQDVTQPLLLNRTKGIETLQEDEQHVWIKVQSGEVWHELVLHALNHNWFGIENLSLIPGTVGAAPMQNIGAYGVEVKEVIESVRYWHFAAQQYFTLSNKDCRFAYRDSIFKRELNQDLFITEVVFKLNKIAQPNTGYGAIQQQLAQMGITKATPQEVSKAVIAIRSSKLPDPKITGNAGSFFKNPTITTELYEAFFNPDMPFYPLHDGSIKIPAGWLIEQCGWKGYREGDAGVHPLQALVLVNYGQATGKEIYHLSTLIVESVQKKFGITLEREVQIW